MAVPSDVGSSKISNLIVAHDWCRLYTIDGKKLTVPQLQEVADVYNAWRVGNLQDCTITSAQTLTDLMERSWH